MVDCGTCMKKYPDDFALKNHINNYHKDYFCTPCQEAFPSKITYDTHVRKVHQKVKYQCNQCGKDMCNLQSLTYHVTNVHSEAKNSKKVKKEMK